VFVQIRIFNISVFRYIRINQFVVSFKAHCCIIFYTVLSSIKGKIATFLYIAILGGIHTSTAGLILSWRGQMSYHAIKSRIQRSFRSSLLILGVLANLGMSTPYNRTDGNLWQEKNSATVSQQSGYGIDEHKTSQLFIKMPALVTPFAFMERITRLELDSPSLLSKHPYTLQDDPPPPVECYSLATGSNPAQGGDVLVSPGPDCGIDQYTPGTEITLTAMPEADYTFSGWSGNANGFDNPLVFIISGNYSMTADFELTQIPLECYSLQIINTGGGTVTSDPAPNCNGTQYLAGTTVTLTGYPDAEHFLSGWVDRGDSNPLQVVMTSNQYVQPMFTPSCYSIATSVTPSGSGSVTITPPPNCSDGVQWTYGTYVSFTETPAEHYDFDYWSTPLGDLHGGLGFTLFEDVSIAANFSPSCYSVIGIVQPAGTGDITISPGPNCPSGGVNTYIYGTSLTASANATLNYGFIGWREGDLLDATNPATRIVSSDMFFLANFEHCRELTYTINPPGTGTVLSSPQPNCNNGYEYNPRSTVEMTAVPAEWYAFNYWSSYAEGENPTIQIEMWEDQSVTANFKPLCYTLDYSINPSDASSIDVNPEPNCDDGTGTIGYTPGTEVALRTYPSTGFYFLGWSGDAAGSSFATTLTMSGNRSVVADFQSRCFSLTSEIIPENGGSVSMSPPPNCSNGTQYQYGTYVKITAIPEPGFTFIEWGGNAGGSNNPIDFMVGESEEDQVVVANFHAGNCYSLTTRTTPSSVSPGAITIDPPPDCGSMYSEGTQVSLTAMPGGSIYGWYLAFSYWSGSVSSTAYSVNVTMDGNQDITANYYLGTAPCRNLSIAVNPLGAGSVTADPSPNCNGGTQYVPNTLVELTAEPAEEYSFSHWGGSVSGAINPEFVTMNGDKNIAAYYSLGSLPCVSLSTVVAPEGSGSVTVEPAPNCSGGTQYIPGTQVILSAAPVQGYAFDSWSGDLSETTNPKILALMVDTTITANFLATPCYAVSVDINPPGSGSFSVSPSPNCGGTGYAWNTGIVITPNASSGYQFVNWNIGDLVFDEGLLFPQLLFMISDNVHVTANFEPISTCYSLTTSQFPDDGGSVSVSPPPNCSNGTQYTPGTHVSITAIPEPGFSFIGWSEFVSGSENPLEYVVEATEEDQVVIANFHAGNCYSLTTRTTPSSVIPGAITIDPPPDCGSMYSEGTQVSLTAMPGGSIYGWFLAFSYWSGSASGIGNPLVVTMDENKDITANYYLGQSPCRTLTLDVNPTDSGSIITSPAPNCNGGTQYTPDTNVSLTAHPAPGFILSHWSGGTGNSDLMTSVGMAVDHNITANFVQGTCYSLTMSTIGDGTVTIDPPPNCNGNTQYLPGTTVQLLARPMDAEMGRFFEWGGEIQGTINPISMTLDHSASVTANFESGSCHTLTTRVAGNGTITTDPLPDCNNGTQYSFESTIVVSAIPEINNLFSAWSGSINDTNNPVVFNMVEDTNLTATFTENPCYTLVVSVDPSDAGFVTADPAPNCNNGTQYLSGTSVNLRATPYPSHAFIGWGGDLVGMDNPAEILMDNNRTVTIDFSSFQCYGLTLRNHDSLGLSDAQPFGGQMEPPPNCGEQYIEGTQVVLSPLPDGSLYGFYYSFSFWSGSASGSGVPLVVTMDGDKDITANYYVGQYPCVSLETMIMPGGTGAIMVEPAPNCSSGTKYIPGTQVTVSAVPIQGYAFDSWGGGLTGNTNPEILTMSSDTLITANFMHDELCFTLDTLVYGNGLIDTTPTPNCNGGSEYFAGTMVMLSATAAPGWLFAYWGGDIAGTIPIYNVHMDSDQSVQAVFGLPPGVPKLLLPENKDNLKSHTVTLDWADPIPPADHYILQISKHHDFNDIVFTAEDNVKSEYPFIVPDGNVRYYWRVQAVNALGQTSDWSVTFNFRTHKTEKEFK
jgi:hypothetical protein